MKKPNSLSQVIDMETEQFLTYIHNISNLTELLSLKKLLEAEYQRVCLVKDGLLEMRKSNKYNSKSTPETVEESPQSSTDILDEITGQMKLFDE